MGLPKKIILIDDSFTTNFLNQMVIQKSKYDQPVETFQNPEDAVTSIQIEHADSSELLIFVDINMPVLDGWQVVQRLEEIGIVQQNVIVMLTSSIDPKDQQRALDSSAIHDFRTKPLTIEMLDEIIDYHFFSESSVL